MSFKSEQHRPLLLRGPSPGLRFLLLCVVSALLMVLDHQQNHTRTLRAALSVATYPLQVLVNLPYAASVWISESLGSRDTLLEENARLRSQILGQQFQVQKLEALQAENNRLREMMRSAAEVAERILVAEIRSVDMDPYRHRLVINKGSRDGVYDGQAILDAYGLVGQVTSAEPLSSRAILITDPSHATPVEINRNGIRTVALGSGDPTALLLPFLPNSTDIQVGDLLVTSGLGGHFPPGYPVGVVDEVLRDPGQNFATVHARPSAQLDRGRQVLLVWFGTPRASQDLVESEPEP
ncbi:MAG: rod shape-determining protein MreC [Gammaproteobacteria bacterium]|nr:rod shape-determining protein MreC [Gammaproteobacteria bacterium]